MDLRLFEKLHQESLISNSSMERIRTAATHRFLSLHWELRILLYLGVSLLSAGLGIWVYKHIDTIGHQAILCCIAAISAGCFWYCYKKKAPFSWQKIPVTDVLADYLLLLACLTFVTFIAYLQYQYTVFGPHPRVASFIPLVALFFSAYYFDHLGVLSLAITNLAAWMGLTVTPLQLLRENDFSSVTIIWTAIILGVLLILTGGLTARLDIKRHFRFTYLNIGAHVLFIAVIAAMVHYDHVYFLWFLVCGGIAGYFYQDAIRQHSFYFILVLTLYTYIALGYVVVKALIDSDAGDDSLYFLLLYFIGSAIGMIRFLVVQNKKIKKHARL